MDCSEASSTGPRDTPYLTRPESDLGGVVPLPLTVQDQPGARSPGAGAGEERRESAVRTDKLPGFLDAVLHSARSTGG